MSSLLFYAITVLSKICYASAVVAILVGVFIGGRIVFCILENEAFIEERTPLIRIMLAVFSISSCVALFVPTKQEMVTIYVLPKIVNNEQLSTLPGNVLAYVNEYLKSETDRLAAEVRK